MVNDRLLLSRFTRRVVASKLGYAVILNARPDEQSNMGKVGETLREKSKTNQVKSIYFEIYLGKMHLQYDIGTLITGPKTIEKQTRPRFFWVFKVNKLQTDTHDIE